MKFKVELFIHKDDFDIADNKSKSMINALQREAIQKLVETAVPNSWVTIVRKVQDERTCA
jgi:hypothetical protein